MLEEDKKIYDQFFEMLRSPNEIVCFEEIFPLIISYAECRRKDMGVEKSIFLYLKYPYTETVGNGTRITAKRHNPITKDSYDAENWGYFTGAFANGKGIFVDFMAVDNFDSTSFKGLWKVKNIIEFIHNLDHELMHAVRDQIFKEGRATKKNMRFLKDYFAISYFDSSTVVNEKLFYHNAHHELFLEEEANNHSKDYIAEKIEEYQLEEVPPFDGNTVTGLIKNRLSESVKENKSFSYHFTIPLVDGSVINEEFNTIPEHIVSYLADYLVCADPELIEKHPMLLIEYNEDGTKKTYSEIEEFRYKLFSIPGISINGIETGREDLFELCDSIVESSPLLMLQKLEQQLGKNLYDAKSESRETVFTEGIASITQLIESENFFHINALLYLEKRDSEIDDKYIPASRECYRRVFESVKERLQSKTLNKQNIQEHNDEDIGGKKV